MKGYTRWAALAAVLFLGFALRLNLSVKAFFSTFDTSTVGLMGLHILEGERPLFYYGQDYMGALEGYVAALMFALFGVSTTSLSLSPILFALGWIAATYLLFTELFDAPAGIAAALCTSACGWYPLWFSMASNGGYPGTFFFGTIFLYLAVRLVGRELSPGRQWGHAVAMGVAAALGVWTNFQVFSFVAAGALILAGGVVKRRFSPSFMLKVAAGGLIGLGGLLPLVSARGGLGTETAGAHIALTLIPENARLLLTRLPKLFLWPVRIPVFLQAAALASFAVAAALYLVKIISSIKGRERLRSLVPLLFTAVFLLLYLAHPFAGKNAVRYLIPLVTVITAAVFGASVTIGKPWLRGAGWALVSVWAIYNASSALTIAEDRKGRKKDHVRERTEIIRDAESAGLRHLMILGSPIDGLNGQSLSFYAEDRVRFVASAWERYHPAAESAELDPAPGFLLRKRHLRKVKNSLASVGVPSYRKERSRHMIIHDIEVPHARRRSVPPEAMKVEIEGSVDDTSGEALLDRVSATAVSPAPGDKPWITLTVSLERTLEIDGLWFTAGNSGLLPRSFDIEASLDGLTYRSVGMKYRDVLPTYIAGNRVYMMGYYTRNDLRFPPVKARHIRIHISSKGRTSRSLFEVNELFLFERLGGGSPVADGEVALMASGIAGKNIDFTVADRWLSPRLGALLPSGGERPSVYPRFNPRHRHTLISRRLAPRPGLGVAVENALADECESLLERFLPAGAGVSRLDFPHYTLYTFEGPADLFDGLPASLVWNGHMILQAGAPENK